MSVQDNVFFKAFGIVLGALVLFTVSIIFLANRISAPDSAYVDPLAKAQTADRLRPVGMSRVSTSSQ